ncbi:hypothetical protein [Hyphomicrobium sp. CS1GBMeth3]|uniref:hypothetical protein n=1 Tax=Hyphomicrobium sp. CS1GBMeth3 TaxID=1892845 RepID=UPI001AEC9792|nr:hypothetical protein [Hyphomicrobium sp. CS1GBMeth3]
MMAPRKKRPLARPAVNLRDLLCLCVASLWSNSALLIAVVLRSLALLVRAIVLEITRLRVAIELVLILTLPVWIALLPVAAGILVLLVLLIPLSLAALLTGIPVLVCHRDVSSFFFVQHGNNVTSEN